MTFAEEQQKTGSEFSPAEQLAMQLLRADGYSASELAMFFMIDDSNVRRRTDPDCPPTLAAAIVALAGGGRDE